MPTKIVFVMLTCILVLTGCAASIGVWSSDPIAEQVENPYFRATVKPEKDQSGFFTMFHIEVTNKTEENLDLDWNESRYLLQGKTADRLVFEGVDPEDLKRGSIPMEKIAPGQTVIKNIGPFRFVSFAPNRYKSGEAEASRISFGPLPEGYNGVQLVIRTVDKAIVEDLQMRLSSQ